MYANPVGAALGLGALIELLLIAAFFVACYFITKAAVREGIRESGLIEATRQRVAAPPAERTRKWSNTTPEPMPDMRADR